jgi:tetratricopeptide (TPR) repeat protein
MIHYPRYCCLDREHAGSYPSGMNRFWQVVLLTAIAVSTAYQNISVLAETETIDLKALAKNARPAVMLLVVSDSTGKEIATGTGFLVSSDGRLITNHHVIENASSVVAKSENGGLFPVEGVLADDPKNDLVLLKLKANDLPFLTFGNSNKVEVGTRIAVIGSPLGLEGTLSEGIVSGERELMGDVKKLQISAAISPGSSGSPVMNAKGDVVGIASALLTGGQSLNFAVPVEYGVRLMAKVKPSSVPQPLSRSTNVGGEDAIYSDPDLRAAIAAEAAGDYVEKLKHDKVLIARYPDSDVAWYGLGITFGKLNFTDDAIEAYQQAIKIKPDFAGTWYNLGTVYGKSGRIDDAITTLRQAIKLKPDYAWAWNNLGVVYQKAGRTDDAIAAYRQVIKLSPDDAIAWYGLGVGYGKSERNDEAITAYRQAIKLKPDYPVAWHDLGIVYGMSRRTDDAIAAYREAIKLKTNYAAAWYGLGINYANSGRTDDAISAYRQAVTIKPDYVDAWNNLGVCLRDSGRTNEAHDAFQRADSLKP